MGYLVEFHGIDLPGLRALLGSGNRAALHALIAAGPPHQTDASDARDWKPALTALLTGERGRELAQRGPSPRDLLPEESTDAEALAFCSLVRHTGHYLGEVVHTSRGGERFRTIFSPPLAGRLYGAAPLLPLLLRRPWFGLIRSDFPQLGGLDRSEVAELVASHLSGSHADMDDPDLESWAYDLHERLLDAADYGLDLVTLYV